MTATRIVLPSKHKPFAEELLAVTGIDSLSNLFVVFLTRYGSHLKASWNITQSLTGQHFPSAPVTYQAPEYLVTQSQINYHQDHVQQIDHVQQVRPTSEPEIDPVIAHIAKHLDRF